MYQDVRLLLTKIKESKSKPLVHQELLEPELWMLARVVAASEKIIPEQMVVLQDKGLRMLADVAFVVKITELLLPNVQNTQLKPMGTTMAMRGYSLVPALRLHLYVKQAGFMQERNSYHVQLYMKNPWKIKPVNMATAFHKTNSSVN